MVLLPFRTGRKGCTGRLFFEAACSDGNVVFSIGDDGVADLRCLRLAERPIHREESFHHGIDLACAEGTPVLASMDGVVVSARYSTTYGNVLRVCHSGGQETLYAHMQYLYVRAGEVVQSGQPIGTVGRTGRATGAHLHIELYQRGRPMTPPSF